MFKKTTSYFLILLLLSDIGYSFVQHLSMPLDGDMAGGIVPGNGVAQIFKDPFGVSVITKNAIYPNPNRFFAHLTFYEYFNYLPGFLQRFVNPIDSIYLSCALAKIAIQIAFIVLFSFYITGKRKIFNNDFLLSAILIVPLFQTNGYRSYMGIIDPSITYTFFYALPCAILLLIYLPFFRCYFYDSVFPSNKFILFIIFASTIFITLNGPLVPGIVLVIFLVLIFNLSMKGETISRGSVFQKLSLDFMKASKTPLIFFGIIGVLSLYSLYIGSNNAIFLNDSIPISQRYIRIPLGIYTVLTQKIGFPVLLLMILINAVLIYKYFKNDEGAKILNIMKCIGLFSFLYIILLPLGGYKSYRPNIVRYDTIMPITIALIFFYGKSTFFIMHILSGKSKFWYVFLVFSFSALFTLSDKPEFKKNECEKAALNKIAIAKERVVLINSECSVLSWGEIKNPIESDLNSQLLIKWKVINEKKLYYWKF